MPTMRGTTNDNRREYGTLTGTHAYIETFPCFYMYLWSYLYMYMLLAACPAFLLPWCGRCLLVMRWWFIFSEATRHSGAPCRYGVPDKLCIFPADKSLLARKSGLLLVWPHQIPSPPHYTACMYMCSVIYMMYEDVHVWSWYALCVIFIAPWV